MYVTVITQHAHAHTHTHTHARARTHAHACMLFTYIISIEYYDVPIVKQKELNQE